MQRATATIRAAKFVAGWSRVPERENWWSPREASVLAYLRILSRKISFCERWNWAAITLVACNERRQQRKRTGSHDSRTCPSGQAQRTTKLSHSLLRTAAPLAVISSGARRRFFFPLRSREVVGWRNKKSLSSFPGRETVRRTTAPSHSAKWPQEILRQEAARVRALCAHKGRHS
jgi:hypothetical protein